MACTNPDCPTCLALERAETERERRTDMKRVCGWCGLVMADGAEPSMAGCCPTCLARELANLAAWKESLEKRRAKGMLNQVGAVNTTQRAGLTGGL